MTAIREQHVPAAFGDGVPAAVHVGGVSGETADVFAIVERYTPIVFAFVLGFSFIVLLLVFRSIVIPIKAVVMNLLSVGAAYGILVLVFQKGVGTDLLGFQHAEVIDVWIPLFLFSILFGLSMDYHVFLLSRVRERYDQTGNNAEAVAYGLRETAGMITGAALIMVAVFGAFASGKTIIQPAGRIRPRRGDPPRCDTGEVGPRAREHGAAGQPQLVPAVVAELAPRPAGRAGRGVGGPEHTRRPRGPSGSGPKRWLRTSRSRHGSADDPGASLGLSGGARIRFPGTRPCYHWLEAALSRQEAPEAGDA